MLRGVLVCKACEEVWVWVGGDGWVGEDGRAVGGEDLPIAAYATADAVGALGVCGLGYRASDEEGEEESAVQHGVAWGCCRPVSSGRGCVRMGR